jgi:hypothetical protein
VEAGDLPGILEANLASIAIKGVSAITEHADISNDSHRKELLKSKKLLEVPESAQLDGGNHIIHLHSTA